MIFKFLQEASSNIDFEEQQVSKMQKLTHQALYYETDMIDMFTACLKVNIL